MKIGTVLVSASLVFALGGCLSSEGRSGNGDSIETTKTKHDVSISKEDMATKQSVPLYPGAEAPNGKSTVTAGEGQTRYELTLASNDSVQKVVDFYRSKVSSLDGAVKNGAADLLGQSRSDTYVHIVVAPEKGKTSIHVIAMVETPAQKP